MTFVHDFFLPSIMCCKVVDIVGCHCCIPLCGWIMFMPYTPHFISPALFCTLGTCVSGAAVDVGVWAFTVSSLGYVLDICKFCLNF